MKYIIIPNLTSIIFDISIDNSLLLIRKEVLFRPTFLRIILFFLKKYMNKMYLSLLFIIFSDY